MIIQNLKVAIRNLLKYKFQTFISVVTIAIGIVTLSLVHSVMTMYRLPSIYGEPYYDRAYQVKFKSVDNGEDKQITPDIIRALKRDGGPGSAAEVAVNNFSGIGIRTEFHLADSTVRKGQIPAKIVDSEYLKYAGLYSALTGKKIRALKAGEAIIGESLAKKIFYRSNPVGAVQTMTSPVQKIPVTIVDVYKAPSLFDNFPAGALCYCLTDNIEDFENDEIIGNYSYIDNICVKLREGHTEPQLLNEINGRVEPFGVEAVLSKIAEDLEITTIIGYRLLAYALGALILLASVIGFLRMQIQLIGLRRREVSLRIVNGASRMQLFLLLFTEVAISVSLAVILAVMLGYMVQDFFNQILEKSLDTAMTVNNLWRYSLATGAFLLVVCSLIAWITLLRICKSSRGLAVGMRAGRSHLFRNIMLGVQITISIVFACSTFIFTNGVIQMLETCNIPANDAFYKKCLYLKPYFADNPHQLIEEISHISSLDKIIQCGRSYAFVEGIENNPELQEQLNNIGRAYFMTIFTADTAAVSFLGIDVEWLNRDINPYGCLLISEKLYSVLSESGLSETLTISQGSIPLTFPIVGVIKNIPYQTTEYSIVAAISPDLKAPMQLEYALVPKPGREKELAQSVDETIRRLEPEIMDQMVFNFRDNRNEFIQIADAARTGAWILFTVSLMICAMGIFSTIALDTRARKKEVAIRKVNGATGKDIYMMFSKVYVILVTISLLIAVPACILFNDFVEMVAKDLAKGAVLSPWVPIISGVAVVVLLIVVIVGWHIRNVMRTNPGDIISKE